MAVPDEPYRDQGIPDVWLLGHASKHLQAARKHSWEMDGAADGLVALGVLTADVVHAASRVTGGWPPRAEWARAVL